MGRAASSIRASHSIFPAPASFTGEDVLELQGHGGPVVMDLLLRCLQLGARVARPGEFTERAFLNGKIDLAQAEAIADLIESSTALAARLAGRSLQGVFSRGSTRSSSVSSGCGPSSRRPSISRRGAGSRRPTSESPTICGAHRPDNRGHGRRPPGSSHPRGSRSRDRGSAERRKSSITQCLVRSGCRDRHPDPRHHARLLKLDIQVDGLPIRIVDTAGLRHSEDLVEREGVRPRVRRSTKPTWSSGSTTPPRVRIR
jgi:tRNA modification GTPase